MSLLPYRYLLFNWEGKKQVTLAGQCFQGQIIRVSTKYWQIEEAEIFFEQCIIGQSQA